MQFVLAIYEDDAVYDHGTENQAWQDIIDAHTKLGEEMAKAGVIRGGEGLQRASTATSVHTRSGAQSIHDGAFAETKEQLGGFYVIEVDTLDDAIAWAKKIPLAGDGVVEVRPTLGREEG